MADIMLSKMFEMADKKQVLPENWWEQYVAEMRKPLEERVKAGKLRKEFLEMFDCEVYGNDCPVCGSTPEPYQKEVVFGGHRLGQFSFYRMTCDCETTIKQKIAEQKEMEERIASADIPDDYIIQTWNDWDPTTNPKITESFRKVQGMSYGAGLNRIIGNGLVLYGDVGRGKTMSAMLLMKEILQKTKSKCKYIPMADFTSRIMRSGKDGNYLDEIEKYDVLFLDDMDKLSTSSPWVQERVFSLFDTIFRKNKTLLLTTNLHTIPEMEDYFGTHGEAIISRMVDCMEFVGFIGGDDYRKKRRMERAKN